ncbi:MAG: hypothetical protein IKO47_02650 [Ruminococcus sp.]|nr:hypothetical protein [Ruminococcus sp.]
MENETLLVSSELCDIRKVKRFLTVIGIILIIAAVGLYIWAYFWNINFWKDLYKRQTKMVVEDINENSVEHALAKYDSDEIVKLVTESKNIHYEVVYKYDIVYTYSTAVVSEHDSSKFASAMRKLTDSDLKKYAKETASITDFFMMKSEFAWISLIAGIVSIIAGIWYYKRRRVISVNVTDKRVYGTRKGGKDVQIAINQINSVSSKGEHGFVINTSGGDISFSCIKNRDVIVRAISESFANR